MNIQTSSFVDTRTDVQEFAIRIYRSTTTVQLTRRLLVRSILDHNSYNRTFGGNLLVTYRVNAGTAFYVGYDDRLRQGDRINASVFPSADYLHTNKAVFAKLQVLFRY